MIEKDSVAERSGGAGHAGDLPTQLTPLIERERVSTSLILGAVLVLRVTDPPARQE